MRPVVSPRHILVVALAGTLVLNVISLVLRLLSLERGIVSTSVPGQTVHDLSALATLLRQFDVETEGNVPTWASGALLLMAALVLWGLADAARRAGEPGRRHWAVLAVAFCYLSLDEVAGLHEGAIRYVAGLVPQEGVFTFGWVLVAGPLVVVFGLSYLRFLGRLNPRTRQLFIWAGALYVGGALAMEMVSGALDSAAGRETVAYVLASSAEELMEMLGASIFLYAVARHAALAADGRVEGDLTVQDGAAR